MDDLESVRAAATRGDPVLPATVMALCDRLEAAEADAAKWRRQASLWADNIEDLTRERDGLRAAITHALDACPFCRQGECRAEAHQWLRDALSPDAGAPLLSLLTHARAWAGAIQKQDVGEIERCANELILAVARCG